MVDQATDRAPNELKVYLVEQQVSCLVLFEPVLGANLRESQVMDDNQAANESEGDDDDNGTAFS